MKMHGKVKMWNGDRGFGFISRDDGCDDVFAHVSSLPEGHDELAIGDLVEFELVPGRNGRLAAANVKVL